MTLDELIYRHLELGGRIARDHPNRKDIDTMIEADKRLEEIIKLRKQLKFIKERLDTLAESACDKAVREWAEAAIVKMETIA